MATLLTIREFADEVGVSTRTARYWVNSGVVSFRQFTEGGKIYIPSSQPAKVLDEDEDDYEEVEDGEED